MKAEQINILVIDSDRHAAQACADVLTKHQYNVTLATSSEEIRSNVESSANFHLVITELNLPDNINPFDIIRQMRENHRYTCAVILTDSPSLETALQAIHDGFCDYLQKPVDENQLLPTIECALSKRGIYLTTDQTIHKVIGARLRQLRREAGLTTQQLADRVGVTQSQISQVETGRSAASIVTLYKIARALNMSLGEIFEGI